MSEAKTQAAAAAHKLVTELKVAGHLMTFDAGLFCIFNQQGSPVPDPATGLPGVRVSLAPGAASHPEAVTITSFRDDGWLGGWNGAALVRVVRGPAQILVTVYQAPNPTVEAPRLQIVRLAEAHALPPVSVVPGPRAVPVPVAAPAQTAAAQTAASEGPTQPGARGGDVTGAEILAHIQGAGDVGGALGQWVGKSGSGKWIEGFTLAPKGAVGAGDIEYQAVLGRGWLSPWSEGGQFCGSRGMSLPILGLRVRLRGEAAEKFDAVIEASFVDGTKAGPADDGEPVQAESMSPLEAFSIALRPKRVVSGAQQAKPTAERGAARGRAVQAPPKQPAKPGPGRRGR